MRSEYEEKFIKRARSKTSLEENFAKLLEEKVIEDNEHMNERLDVAIHNRYNLLIVCCKIYRCHLPYTAIPPSPRALKRILLDFQSRTTRARN